ncbi:ThuA domain-containing protein [Hyunsoonleella flava]|uniref:ThuA domain-containing protein n=1 Tax=Hyunsoonleella flava TaxID=2527939 RepID=A0A4Q9FH89_9FLAO|nr:ThuA domain-containing protein [Hyunsoonleella flava]TBN00457.1 ThuA domain-containing protein [Hyunsoonleella flava]
MKSIKITVCLFCAVLFTLNCKSKEIQKKDAQSKLKALIIDGESGHGIWPKSTFMIKSYLEETGLFDVDVARKKYLWIGPHHNKVEETDDIKELLNIYPFEDGIERIVLDSTRYDPSFSPDFKKYDVIVNNLGWKSSEWPKDTKQRFEDYMKNGGGLVIVHSANNAWGQWEEYNKMIGLGGWGGRTIESGPYVYFNKNDELIKDPAEGPCATHGPQHNYIVKTRAPEHPIMKGLPKEWLHNKDELYERMRGPAENMTILATAYSDSKHGKRMTDRHEPLLMTIEYGKGRTFHTALGHMDYSMECAGFITTLQRGAEWAATGEVTQAIPEDFPTTENTSIRKWRLN